MHQATEPSVLSSSEMEVLPVTNCSDLILQDSHGNPFKLIITQALVARLHQIGKNRLAKEGGETIRHGLRVNVDDGGCSGFEYQFSIVDFAQISDASDYIFNLSHSDGSILKVVADSITMEYINGATIDFHSGIMRSGFEVRNNPKAELGCSCGSSFAPKLD